MNNAPKPEGPKQPIKSLNATLTEEQKEAKQIIYNNTVTVLYGKAGTSKSFVAVNAALDMLLKKQVEKIIIIRPTVTSENIGFLPGDVKEKMIHYFIPILQNMNDLIKKEKVEELLKKEAIQILPLAFIQGVTINDVAIADEAQNMTVQQMKLLLTRVGKHGKLILTGDTDQVLLPPKEKSGFDKLLTLEGKISKFSTFELKQNYRDPFVKEILEHYK